MRGGIAGSLLGPTHFWCLVSLIVFHCVCGLFDERGIGGPRPFYIPLCLITAQETCAVKSNHKQSNHSNVMQCVAGGDC